MTGTIVNLKPSEAEPCLHGGIRGIGGVYVEGWTPKPPIRCPGPTPMGNSSLPDGTASRRPPHLCTFKPLGMKPGIQKGPPNRKQKVTPPPRRTLRLTTPG